MIEALDKTPKPVSRIPLKTKEIPPEFNSLRNTYKLDDDEAFVEANGFTCHSTPSKKQDYKCGEYGRFRNSSLPSSGKAKQRSSSYSYSYDRRNSLESDLELGGGSQSILQEKRLEFERRRRQVKYTKMF